MPGDHWTIDKRVPLALILTLAGTLLAQSIVAVRWAAAIDSRQDVSDQKISALEAQRAGERLAVLEATVGDVRAQLTRIEGKLDRIVENRNPHP